MNPIMYSTKKLSEVWGDVTTYLTDLNNAQIPLDIQDNTKNTIYYLLYARYGNSPIANYDVNQFKYKIYSIIFQYGPTWEKELEIQSALRHMTEEEITAGNKSIFNHALNPADGPSTCSMEELKYINDQNTTNTKRGKIEGYALLMDLLKNDVTEAFIKRFEICFKQFVRNEHPVIYESDKGEE